MAKKRSKKRRQTGRTSFPPSIRPSEAPPTSVPPSDAKPTVEAKSSVKESDRDVKSADTTKKRKSSGGSFFDIPPNDQVEAKPNASGTKDQAPSKPAKEAKEQPRDLKEEKQGSDPGGDDAPDSKPSASPNQTAKSKDERQDGPDQDEGEKDSGEEAAHDDGLHDDFFRKGEEVEKEHIAAREQVVNGAPKLEDTGQRRLVALRTDPKLVARRKKLRKIVAYVLAPAVVISVIAGFKAYNGEGASARTDEPVARVTVQPSAAPDPTPAVTSVAAPVASSEELVVDAAAESDGSAPDGEAEVADAAAEVQDAAVETGTASDAAAKVEVAAETEAADEVPAGVDARKEALSALNRAKWADAEKMARAAITKEPEDATLYLYQGTALQEMGRRSDAKVVFKACVDNAKRGPINECRMFAR